MENLRKIFVDICRGYSDHLLNDKHIYIRHLSHFDQINIDDKYDIFYSEAKNRGLYTFNDKIKFLESEGLWSKKNQQEIDETQNYLNNLKITKNSLAFKSQIDPINKQIKEAEDKYIKLITNKNNLIGMTCENYANRKIELFYIELLFYSDNELKDKLFHKQEFDNAEEDLIDKLLSLYSSFVISFSNENIKKISVSNFFTSLLYLSDNLESFFGKALCNLTFYQSNLLSWGIYYKNISKNNEIPNDIMEDPDKIEEFIKKSINIKQIMERSGGQRVGIVGATNKELKEVGGGDTPDILKYNQKMGGIDSIFADKNVDKFN